MKQLKNMKDPKRRIATLVFIGSMIMTFVCVFAIKSKLLTLIFIVFQFVSYIWYVLSYIPYGREICSACVKKITGIDIFSAGEQAATAVSTNAAESV